MRLFYKIQAWKKISNIEMVQKMAIDSAAGKKRYWKAKERVTWWDQAGSIVGYAMESELPEDLIKYAIERAKVFIGNMIRIEIWHEGEVIRVFSNHRWNGKQWIKKR
jgi:DNA-binding transcriptional regulator/RsmH inhibitor MraZ